jgi:transmembrane sensor
MEKSNSYYRDLLFEFVQNNLPVEQENDLFDFIQKDPERFEGIINEEGFQEKLVDYAYDTEINVSASVKDRMRERLLKATGDPVVSAPVISIRKNRKWWAAAAVFVLVGGIGAYFLANNKQTGQLAKLETQEQRFKNDIPAPQTNKATLTLSDGSTVTLDSAGNGSVARQGNVDIVKTEDGQIAYNGNATEVEYNTLTVPRGSKPVQLKLADGTEVWLNVASSITYPTAFISGTRKVQITGEAYFEVAHNAAMPFVVEKNQVSVQVLGTHFNVNTYDDEDAIRITLLEGSVKVTKGKETKIIKPGEQAIVKNNGQLTTGNNIDLEEVMAWKNGVFKFKGVGIESVMKQVEKWYDVEVKYDEKINSHFYGTIPRNVSMINTFKVLEETGLVHFKIVGKKVIAMP